MAVLFRALVPLVTMSAVVVVVVAAAAAAPAVELTQTDEIAFTQTLLDVWSVLEMRADGTAARRLTVEETSDSWPVKSPDGKFIALASRRDGQWELYVMRSDGTGLRRVTRHPSHDVAPDWSPDSRRLVFSRGPDGRSAIYVVSARGGQARRATRGARGDDEPAWSPDGHTIAFTRPRTKTSVDVWTVDLRTGRERRLTRGPRDDWGPRWSPDGRRLAFASGITTDEGYLSDIAVMRADGSGRRRFRKAPGLRNQYPTWSPDGSWIAFWSTRGDAGVWLMRPDGTGRRQLPPTACCESWDYYNLRWARDGTMTFSYDHAVPDEVLLTIDGPGARRRLTSGSEEQEQGVSWAPDGRSFVFTRFLGECCSDDIFVHREDGSEENLSRHPERDAQPDLSPDGTSLVFATERGPDESLVDLWLVGSDGDDARPLVQSPENDAQPDWSTDGRRIVFARFPAAGDDGSPPGDIFVTDLAGRERRLTTHPANDEEPRWSPDGRRIVFTSTRSGRFQLYVMDTDGDGVTLLLASDANDREPSWSPDGTRIVFDRYYEDRAEIWVVGADGTGAKRWTTICHTKDCVESMLAAPQPSWRPPTR